MLLQWVPIEWAELELFKYLWASHREHALGLKVQCQRSLLLFFGKWRNEVVGPGPIPPPPSSSSFPVPDLHGEDVGMGFSQIQSSVIVELTAGFVSRGLGHVEVPAQVHPPHLAQSLRWTVPMATQLLAGCQRAALQSSGALCCLPRWEQCLVPPTPPPPPPIKQQQQQWTTHTPHRTRNKVSSLGFTLLNSVPNFHCLNPKPCKVPLPRNAWILITWLLWK